MLSKNSLHLFQYIKRHIDLPTESPNSHWMNDKGKESTPVSRQPKLADGVEPSREIDLRDLVGDQREVTIIHDGHRYRLRITATNKLILTK
jgi:hemin uptake protein HemP